MLEKPQVVIKLGGSLLDVPDLGARLRSWIQRTRLRRSVLIPGGGAAADHVRRLQRVHGFSNARAHDWAVAAMHFNARILREIIGLSRVARNWREVQAAWNSRLLPILEVSAFLTHIETHAKAKYPRDWSFTSDSIAAAIATAHGVERLVLLKSRSAKPGLSWEQHAADGLVDDYFPRLAPRIPHIDIINLRAEPPPIPGL